jgi:hypothetical protein
MMDLDDGSELDLADSGRWLGFSSLKFDCLNLLKTISNTQHLSRSSGFEFIERSWLKRESREGKG